MHIHAVKPFRFLPHLDTPNVRHVHAGDHDSRSSRGILTEEQLSSAPVALQGTPPSFIGRGAE